MELWPLARHTAAKHAILQRYLGAWLPIMSRYNRELLVVDGFAGPGEYKGGELGSPLIALDAALQHSRDLSRTNLSFVFVEQDDESRAHLEVLLSSRQLPAHVRVQVLHGSFDARITDLLDELENRGKAPPPAFVMIDPFGSSGVAFEVIQRLAGHAKSEVLFSLMSESINRFIAKPELEQTFDALFGDAEWRRTHEQPTAEKRWRYIYEIFASQLEKAGFQWVRAFEMRDEGDRAEYHLTFATHGREGLKQMKAAMWSVDPSGLYRFSDATNPAQLTLFQAEPDLEQLKGLLLMRFGQMSVEVGELEDFVLCQTAFRETHVRPALAAMERGGTIQAEGKRRSGQFPSGTFIRFPTLL